MDIQQKTEAAGFYKDKQSGSVINKDNSALQAYKARKRQIKKTITMEQRIETLEQEVALLKGMIANGRIER